MARKNKVVTELSQPNHDVDMSDVSQASAEWDDPAYAPAVAEILNFKDDSLKDKPFGPLEVISWAPFTEGSKFPGEPAMKWIFRDKSGKILSCIFGGVTDRNLISQGIAVGDSLLFKYQGKKRLDSGNHVNVFDIRLRLDPSNLNRREFGDGVRKAVPGKKR